jgi:hypothetical protein
MRLSLKIYILLIVFLCLLLLSGLFSEFSRLIQFREGFSYGKLVINLVGLGVLFPSLYYLFLLTQHIEFDGDFIRHYQHKKMKEIKLGSDTTITYGFLKVCISENGKRISLPRSAQSFSIMEKIYQKIAITKKGEKAVKPYEYRSTASYFLLAFFSFLLFSFVLVRPLRSILIVPLVVYFFALLYVLISRPYVVRISYDGIELLNFFGHKKKLDLCSIISAKTDILLSSYRLILILKIHEKEYNRKVVVGINRKSLSLDELINFFVLSDELNSVGKCVLLPPQGTGHGR